MMTTMIIATPYIVYHMLFKALVTLIQFNTYKNLTREWLLSQVYRWGIMCLIHTNKLVNVQVRY